MSNNRQSEPAPRPRSDDGGVPAGGGGTSAPGTAVTTAAVSAPITGDGPVPDDNTWRALRSPLRLRLLEAVGARPRVDARTIAETLGASAPRIYYHLKILLEAGLLVAENDVGRRRARGPEALVYRTSFDDLAAYLARHGGPKELEPIMQELAAAGVADAIRATARGDGRARFMHETLTADEIAEVERALGRIAEILDGARGRRVAADGIGLATVFVGACLAKPSQPSLPDVPVGRLG